jgi:hypothetical protein
VESRFGRGFGPVVRQTTERMNISRTKGDKFVKRKHFVGKETDIAQCDFKCCNATIVDVSRLRVKERRGYSHLKEEALDRTMWRAGFGRGFGTVVRQTAK